MVGLAKVTCKSSGNRLPSFYPHSPLLGTPGASAMTPKVPEVLRDSPLEKLDFSLCSQIPSTAWQRVPSGAWPALHDARGIPEEELSRIVLGGAACLGRKFLACEVGPCIRFWEDK